MRFLFLLLSLSWCGKSFSSNYYFSSSSGDDSRTNTQAQNPATPWASITKLNSFFASLSPGDSILFKRNDLFYGSITINKNGLNGNQINLGAYGNGSNPIITGLTTISGWNNVGNNLWESTSAVSTLPTLKMVVINGVNTPMGRYPNISSTNISSQPDIHPIPGNNGWLNYESCIGNNTITDDQLPASPNWVGAEAVVKKYNWIVDHGIITSHSSHTLVYNPSKGEDDCQAGMSYFIQNDIRTLDEQNEWYYNPNTKKITIYSINSPSNVQVASIQNIINRNSKNYISISNLDVTGSNSDLIYLGPGDNCTGWSISGCNISFAGRDAIFSNGSNVGCTFINNVIADANNNGIYLRDRNGTIIANGNTITNVGINAGMTDQINGGGASCVAILIQGDNGYTGPITIRNNRISHVGYNGIVYLGNNTLVSNNFVDDVCSVKTDGAAIYTWGGDGNFAFSNVIVEDNIVVNGSNKGYIGSALENYELSVNGIYLDGMSNGVILRRNSISGFNASGIYCNSPVNCIIRDNIVYNCRYAGIHINNLDWYATHPALNTSIKNNIVVARSLSTYPSGLPICLNQRCFYYFSTANDISTNIISDSNVYARPIDNDANNPINPGPNYTQSGYGQWGAIGKVQGPDYIGYGEYGPMYTYTLAAWKTAHPSLDQHTTKSPVTATQLSDIRFEYNETGSARVISLGATYIDMKGVIFSGAITLAPFTSTVLVKTSVGNILPTANAGLDQNITLPTNSVNLSGSGTDPDGTITAYLWTKIAGPAAGAITNINSATTSATGLVQGIYKFELKVTDNSGATDTDTMQVTVNPAVNILPTANAGLDQNITLPTNSVNLSGSGTDPDGTITAYLWTKIAGPAAGAITNINSATTSATGLVQGIYKFELKVTDNSGATDTDTMQVTVNPAVNILPTANAGLDQNITLPTNSVNLSGSGTDPDGTITAYLWTKIAGPAAGAITNINSATTSATGLVQGIYKFELKVTDNSGATDTDTMQVTVNPAVNILPTANAGLDQNITLPTNSVNLSGSGTDPDGTITAYLWTKIAGPAAGAITNINSATTSATGLVQGIYKFELKVTDNSGATDTDTMQVTVNPVVNILPTANAGLDQNITLPTNSVNLSGSGTDPDGTITAYLWTKIAGPAAGAITNINSATTSATGLVQGIYKFELKVTDNSGATDTDTMQVTVNPAVNILPTANAGLDQNITLPTNSVNLSGSGTDPDGTITAYLWTKIAGPAAGAITNINSATTSATGLVQGIYKFELKVTDNSGATDTDTMQVTVNPAVNILPTANAGLDQNITLPTNSVNLSGSGTDPDGTITAYLWTKIAGPAAGAITNINSATTSATGLVQGIYKFELKVTDNSGATDTDTMQVTVNPVVNILPTANAGLDQNITLPTNSVNLSGSGTDPDGTITAYLWTKIAGPAAGAITNINSATTSATGLVQGIYKFELKVTDNSGATDTDTMQVTVNPAVNILPTANAGLDQNITLPTNSVNLSGSGTDPDGTITAYLWTKIAGPAAGAITNINSATTSATGLVQGIYKFELKVTDNSGATDTDTMQVTVNPAVNILPTANAGLDQNITLPTNSVNLSGSGTDPDGTITAYLWTKIAGPAAGAITNINSATTSATGLVQGIYKFELKVTDNSGATDTDTMQVTVNPAVNILPTANAGLDQNITLPTNSVNLSGSGTDPDGTITAYLWTKIAGPAAGAITNINSATTSATGLVQGIYKFELKVTDNSGATDTDTMQVTVNPAVNILPTANAGLDQNITLPTNSVNLSGSGTDPDGTITAYLWTKIAGPAAGAITNINSATTSATGLVQGIYKFELKVTDNSGATDTDTMQVTVNPAPPPPNQAPIANAGTDTSIYLPNNSITLSGSGIDNDGYIVSYSWRILSTGAYTLLNPNITSPDLNDMQQGIYEAELTVTDNSGAIGKDTVVITVGSGRLSAVNDGVIILGNPIQNLLIAEISASTLNSLMKIVLFDIRGVALIQKEFMLTQNVQLEKIDMSRYCKGTYILRVYFEKNQSPISKEIIKL